jgi:hypothetical protein
MSLCPSLRPVVHATQDQVQDKDCPGSQRAAMPDQPITGAEVDRFILEEIDSVTQLEALLLLWNARPRQWKLDDLAAALYIAAEAAKSILDPLERRGLVAADQGAYAYRPGARDALVEAVDRAYRRELVRISRMIHSKAPSSVLEFARAFRFKKKDRD